MSRLVKLALGLIIPLACLSVLLLSSNLYTYHRLSHETLIAELTFDPAPVRADGLKAQWIAHLATGDRCFSQDYVINGEQWRIDAAFIKWKPLANLLGLDSLYRLDRLEGRFRDTDAQNQHRGLAHDLNPDNVLQIQHVAAALGKFNFLIDSQYGSSVYQEIDPQWVYYLYRTQNGLISRNQPRVIDVSAKQTLTIQINKACGGEPSGYEKTVRWLDTLLANI